MKCVIAGGGTGGHLFPGLAIAEAFVEREKGNEVLFIGTTQGIESKVLAGGKFPLKTIRARPLTGKSFGAKLKALWAVPRAVQEARAILTEFRPHVVLGVGGYASGPALLAASLVGIKRAIHEQNTVPGMANRLLKSFSHEIFVSFEESKPYFPEGKTRVTGMPVRKEFLAARSKGGPMPGQSGETRFHLLVFGGSAGAHRINEAMMGAVDSPGEIKTCVRIVHQTGREDYEAVSKRYQEAGVQSTVQPFFDDMADRYAASDLVVCRAGASTIAELAVCGKAAILVPYPYAARQHQLVNAQKLVDRGAARMIRDGDLNAESLARMVLDLYRHPEQRKGMEEAIREIARPRAAEEIVDRMYALAG